jgi:hypothetical protein
MPASPVLRVSCARRKAFAGAKPRKIKDLRECYRDPKKFCRVRDVFPRRRGAPAKPAAGLTAADIKTWT